jgi:hypothetical protein
MFGEGLHVSTKKLTSLWATICGFILPPLQKNTSIDILLSLANFLACVCDQVCLSEVLINLSSLSKDSLEVGTTTFTWSSLVK